MKVTRGSGLLELFLAKRRSAIARKLLNQSNLSNQSGTGKRILDLGCGRTAFFLSTAGSGFKEKYALDRLPLSTRAPPGIGIIFQQFDLEEERKLPFKDDFFEAATLLAVAEHLRRERLVPLLKEIKRVLAPGGQVIVTTPCSWTSPLLSLMARLRLVSSEEIAEHRAGYTPKALSGCLAQAGFSPEAIKTGYFEFGLNSWVAATKREP